MTGSNLMNELMVTDLPNDNITHPTIVSEQGMRLEKMG